MGANFALVNQYSKKYTEKDFKNKYSIVVFGFSRCASICPTQLSIISELFNKIEGDPNFNKVKAYFISLDPKNDTVEVLNKFSKLFHSKIQMLTGDEKTIQRLVQGYKVYVVPDKKEVFNHSSVVYLIGRDGNFLNSLDISTVESLYQDLIKSMK